MKSSKKMLPAAGSFRIASSGQSSHIETEGDRSASVINKLPLLHVSSVERGLTDQAGTTQNAAAAATKIA